MTTELPKESARTSPIPILLLKDTPPPANYTLFFEMFSKLDRKPGLTLKDLPVELDPRFNSINSADFLFNLMTSYNKKNFTIDEKGAQVTDRGNPNYLGKIGRNRSINEIFDILISYYPNYQINDYLKDIYELAYKIYTYDGSDKRIGVLGLFWCPDIKRSVYYINDRDCRGVLGGYDYDKACRLPVSSIFPMSFISNSVIRNFENGCIWKLIHDDEVILYLVGRKYENCLPLKK